MTKGFVYTLISILVLFLAESAALKVAAPDLHFVPQLLLLTVIALALDQTLLRIIWLSFATGFLLEIFSGYYFGSYIFALVLIGGLTYMLTRKITAREVTIPISLFLVILNSILFVFMVFIYNGVLDFFGLVEAVSLRRLVSWDLIWVLILNLAFFYPVRFILKFAVRTDEKTI